MTSNLGTKFKEFLSKTCKAFTTYELPKEVKKHIRAKLRKSSTRRGKGATQEKEAPKDKEATEGSTRKAVTFNLATYKYHSLADYVDTIKEYGTTDSYSTEIVSD